MDRASTKLRSKLKSTEENKIRIISEIIILTITLNILIATALSSSGTSQVANNSTAQPDHPVQLDNLLKILHDVMNNSDIVKYFYIYSIAALVLYYSLLKIAELNSLFNNYPSKFLLNVVPYILLFNLFIYFFSITSYYQIISKTSPNSYLLLFYPCLSLNYLIPLMCIAHLLYYYRRYSSVYADTFDDKLKEKFQVFYNLVEFSIRIFILTFNVLFVLPFGFYGIQVGIQYFQQKALLAPSSMSFLLLSFMLSNSFSVRLTLFAFINLTIPFVFVVIIGVKMLFRTYNRLSKFSLR